MSESIKIELSKNEALILFELCSRIEESSENKILDQAELRVIWDLSCKLEKVLPEILNKDYRKIIEMAKSKIVD